MGIFVRNRTNAAVVMNSLGVTVPPAGVLDVSYLQNNLQNSSEFMGNIGNSVLSLISATYPSETYYDANSAVNMLQFGVSKQSLGLSDLIVEQGLGGAAIAYTDYSRGKKFYAPVYSYTFSVASATNQTWLQLNPNIYSSSQGVISPNDYTITGISMISDTAVQRQFSIFLDNTEYTNQLVTDDVSLNAFGGLNLDVAAGQMLRIRVYGASILGIIPKKLGAISISYTAQIKAT